MVTGFAPQQKDINIVWGTKTITWDDFKGPRNRKSSGIASTFSYMDIDVVKTNNTGAEVLLQAVFDTEESWVIYKEKTVLAHERGHFDITELYARKLRKKISETTFKKADFRTTLRKLYADYDDEMDKYHDRYDDETESSMNTEKQKAWEAGIKKDIEALNAYKTTTLNIKFTEN